MKKSLKFTQSFANLTASNCSVSDVLFLKNYSLGDFDLVKRSQPFLISLSNIVEKNNNEKSKRGLEKRFCASLPWNEKKLVGMNKYLTDIL